MPNIIVELQREINRVTEVLPRLDPFQRGEADGAIRIARSNMAMNSLEGMKESLADLQEFPKKPTAERSK
jgi:hypothetical protein